MKFAKKSLSKIFHDFCECLSTWSEYYANTKTKVLSALPLLNYVCCALFTAIVELYSSMLCEYMQKLSCMMWMLLYLVSVSYNYYCFTMLTQNIQHTVWCGYPISLWSCLENHSTSKYFTILKYRIQLYLWIFGVFRSFCRVYVYSISISSSFQYKFA